MNIAFFLTPKRSIQYVTTDATMDKVLDKMKNNTYTALPLLDSEGRYVGVITEGDLLWKLVNTPDLKVEDTANIIIDEVERHTHSDTVSIESDVEDLINISINQNFVPVVDDEGIFIGIIKRSDIINYLSNAFFSARSKKIV